jgi:hypothetical protein
MPRFSVSMRFSETEYHDAEVEVEAADPEAAIEAAKAMDAEGKVLWRTASTSSEPPDYDCDATKLDC